MNIAVYLGANEGKDPLYKQAVRELGAWIGKNGHRLIYGGSRPGLMGILAQAVLEANGPVTGVEFQDFIDKNYQMEGLTELIVTENIRQRKTRMMELADAYIAFPGGTGTAEEIAEVISAGSLGMLDGIYGYYNVGGYYDLLRQQYDHMVDQGFLPAENRARIRFWDSLEEIAADLTPGPGRTGN